LDVVILSHDLAENAVGRAYCLWLLCRRLGHQVRIVGPSRGPLWSPLADDPFASDCVPVGRWPDRDKRFWREVGRADLLIAVKTWPASFGAALEASRRLQVPLMLDVDEDDYGALVGESAASPTRVRSRMRATQRGTSIRRFTRLQSLAQQQSQVTLVSSPALLERYPGAYVVPHPRPIADSPREHRAGIVRVGYIGTIRRHKGFKLIREAVSTLADEGVELVVSAFPPRDAQPYEDWRGPTSVSEGRRLLSSCDAVVVPSHPGGYGATQLPAKLIDGLSLGLAAIGSDTPPIRWALDEGRAGLLLDRTTTQSVITALRSLRDPKARAQLGFVGYERARATFSLDAVSATMRLASARAVSARDPL
jgi:glycosyltransferase involved in cell wall biosynthesis